MGCYWFIRFLVKVIETQRVWLGESAFWPLCTFCGELLTSLSEFCVGISHCLSSSASLSIASLLSEDLRYLIMSYFYTAKCCIIATVCIEASSNRI
jgi:hypothetical protein